MDQELALIIATALILLYVLSTKSKLFASDPKDSENWNTCRDLYASTCRPTIFFNKENDFFNHGLTKSDGTPFSCNRFYRDHRNERNQFVKDFFGKGGPGNADGPLYAKCSDGSDPFGLRKTDAENWEKCRQAAAKTCVPSNYLNSDYNSLDLALFDKAGQQFFCTDYYRNNQVARDAFNQEFYGAGGPSNPDGPLFNQYCNSTNKRTNKYLKRINSNVSLRTSAPNLSPPSPSVPSVVPPIVKLSPIPTSFWG